MLGHSSEIRPKAQEDDGRCHRYRNLPEPGVKDQHSVVSQGGLHGQSFEVPVPDVRSSKPHQLEPHTLHNSTISQDTIGTLENGGIRTK